MVIPVASSSATQWDIGPWLFLFCFVFLVLVATVAPVALVATDGACGSFAP